MTSKKTPRVYVDACPFIDMAKFKARIQMSPAPSVQAEREKDVWIMDRMLAAARANHVAIYTSGLTITECVYLGSEVDKIPDAVTQRFFSELLLSGKSGVRLAFPSLAVMERARDLRWKHKITLKPMDSLHVATALQMQCAEIITHDKGIHVDSVRLKLQEMGLVVSHPRNTTVLPHSFMQDDYLSSLQQLIDEDI